MRRITRRRLSSSNGQMYEGGLKNEPNLGGKDGDIYDDKDEEERLYAR